MVRKESDDGHHGKPVQAKPKVIPIPKLHKRFVLSDVGAEHAMLSFSTPDM
jgi:hypothetical protein